MGGRSCVVVGAGMAGLTAAGVLQANGWSVVLLDKGRGVGGRMATRRIGESVFDHGAQFFTVRDDRFRQAIAGWESANWVVPWFTEGGHVRYRGVGGMNALAKHLSEPFNVRTGTRVSSIEIVGDGWRIATGSGEIFEASALLLTAPAPQSLALLSPCIDRLPAETSAALRSVQFDPCWALLVAVPSRVPSPGYVRSEEGPIEWIADNTQKGISSGIAALTIHARGDFSRKYLDAPEADVAHRLLESAGPWFDGGVTGWQLHRWRYSRPVTAGTAMCLFSRQPAMLAIAGDAFGGGRLEGAFLSGLTAGQQLAGI